MMDDVTSHCILYCPATTTVVLIVLHNHRKYRRLLSQEKDQKNKYKKIDRNEV